jgi:hypothetical protein
MSITGSAWNLDDPLHPWAYFDPDSKRDIPIAWDQWLADIQSSYASHTITVDVGLLCPSSIQVNGIVKARIQKDPANPLVVGQKYAVTCHIIAADGEEEDQTVFLKILQK